MSTVTGIISFIGATTQVKETFKKRDFVLTVQSGEYSNLNAFQLVQDKCTLADAYTEGQEVTVHYNIRSSEGKNGGYFTNLTIWKIEGAQAQAPAQSQAPVPVAPKSVAPAMSTAPSFEEQDDLPF